MNRPTPRRRATRATRFRAFGALALLATPAAAQELAPFLVQAGCLDARGALRPGLLPFEPGCDRTRPLRATDPLPYRKHDWPASHEAASRPLGYQASDSVVGRLLGRPAIIQTFDFADATRAWGRVDAGDGGQVVLLGPAGAAVAMTEDGSGGRQWFQGPRCGRPGRDGAPPAPDPGWLLAGPAPREEWQQLVVRLGISPDPASCPPASGPSLTRWRLARLALPWREAASGATAEVEVAALVSEHYAGAGIADALHLERFWFARGLGLVRWERWENPAKGEPLRLEARAALVAGSRRCPAMALGEPPAEGWRMVDCRHWTNLVRARPGAPLAALAWP